MSNQYNKFNFNDKQEEYLFYLLSLISINKIGSIRAKQILEIIPNPKQIFNLKKNELINLYKIPEYIANNIENFNDFKKIEDEIEFIKKNKINVCIYNQPNYSYYLKQLDDAPIIIFSLGNIELNNKKIVSIVGTRYNTEYGKKITEEIVSSLKHLDIIIISGLALGIDSIAHQAAINNSLQTIGVLGHGLKSIFPPQNKKLAKNIIENNGGLLTEFFSNINPTKDTFPIRNRIVAGVCDALIVIETKKKGGSIITANFANNYNKEIFAVPGKIGDEKSEGCNYLIQNNKATILNKPEDILELMNWDKTNIKKSYTKELFFDLNENQKKIIQIFKEANENIHLDTLINKMELPFSILYNELLELEFKKIIISTPGKFYKLY